MFTIRCIFKIIKGAPHSNGVVRMNGHRFPVEGCAQKFEKSFRVLYFVVRSFRENIGYLHKALFFGDRSVIRVAISGL